MYFICSFNKHKCDSKTTKNLPNYLLIHFFCDLTEKLELKRIFLLILFVKEIGLPWKLVRQNISAIKTMNF